MNVDHAVGAEIGRFPLVRDGQEHGREQEAADTMQGNAAGAATGGRPGR